MQEPLDQPRETRVPKTYQIERDAKKYDFHTFLSLINAWSTPTRSRPICMAIMIVNMERGTLHGTRWVILSGRQKNCWLLKKSCFLGLKLVVFSLRPSCTQAFLCLWINDFDCINFQEWFFLLSKKPTRDPTITWHFSPCYPTQALSDDVQTLPEFFQQSSEPFTWFPRVIPRIQTNATSSPYLHKNSLDALLT